jgi:SRSO17 transposase
VRLTRQTLGDQVWEVKAALVWLARKRGPTPQTYWLIVARNVATGEVKYFVSNAPARTALLKLLRVAFRRWNVEHAFRVSKSELGFRHYEGRHYVGWQRHLVLCLLTLTFVAEHAERLRGEKSGGDARASVPGAEPAVRGVVSGGAGDAGVAVHGRGRPVSAAA